MRRRGNPLKEHRPDRRRRDRLLAGGFTVGAHLALIAAMVWWPRGTVPPSRPAEPAPIQISLLETPRPAPPDAPPAPAALQEVVPPSPPRIATPVLTAQSVADTSDRLSDAQLAGAASADGEGSGGGGGCNTAQLVQQALRRDAKVRLAVDEANRAGQAILLWNGDWVRSGGQEGHGLAVVREAVLWALAFAPDACRNKPVQGLVLLSLADGRTRFGIGAGDWRWSDLLGLRQARYNH